MTPDSFLPSANTPPPIIQEDPATILQRLPDRVAQLERQIAKVVIGQKQNVHAALYALLARGHCLMVGVPGLAKTMLVRALARCLELPFARIQFTPDLMPSDITGTEILEEDTRTGHRQFMFARGPVFTQVLLADEINRTPPKTQAALLEAMQEKTVTVAGKSYQLEEPFLVLATQNPIEQEGTYPLPEAQLDRFLFELLIDYPSLDDECSLVEKHSYTPLEQIAPVLGREEILQFRDAVAKIPAAPNVIRYAVRLVRATRPADPQSPDYIKQWVRWGASPRASQNLILAGRARAACNGRFNVACEDVAALAPLVLRHRLIRSFQADAEGKSTDDIIAKVLEDITQGLNMPVAKSFLREQFDPKRLAAFESLDCKARYVMEGFLSGIHESPFHGFSVEFSDYRNYQPGDDLRHLDWRLYARNDRLCIKRYMQETNVRFYLVCDNSASMAYRGTAAWGSKIDCARILAAALTWLLLKQNDAAGLVALSGANPTPDFIRPSQRSTQFGLILRHLESLQPAGGRPLAQLLQHTVRLVHRRSVILFFTDLLEPSAEIAQGLKQLRFHGHDCMIFHVMDQDELEFPFQNPRTFEDLETGVRRVVDPASARARYLERLQTFLQAHRQLFTTLEMPYCLVRTDQDPWRALAMFLSERKRLK